MVRVTKKKIEPKGYLRTFNLNLNWYHLKTIKFGGVMFEVHPKNNTFWKIAFLEEFQTELFSSKICEKFVGGCTPTQLPTQMINRCFSPFRTQEIGSSLVSFQMIFKALQSKPDSTFLQSRKP